MNVRMSLDGKGHILYFMPCEMCGEEVAKRQLRRNSRTLCNYCKRMLKKKDEVKEKEAPVPEAETKAEKRFNKAVGNIEKQVKNFSEYEEAIRLANTRAELYGSTPEAMVAIELIRLKYTVIPQQKVGRYKVDFVLPDVKLAIEVDGEVFHKNNKSPEREATVQLSLGLDWKIVHIPAEMIEKDIQKLETILKL